VSDQAQPDKNEIAKPLQMLAIGLIDDATAYVESARQLDKCMGVSARFFPPIYFLLCQAMELDSLFSGLGRLQYHASQAHRPRLGTRIATRLKTRV
jgi:hypothetical protein